MQNYSKIFNYETLSDIFFNIISNFALLFSNFKVGAIVITKKVMISLVLIA